MRIPRSSRMMRRKVMKLPYGGGRNAVYVSWCISHRKIHRKYRYIYYKYLQIIVELELSYQHSVHELGHHLVGAGRRGGLRELPWIGSMGPNIGTLKGTILVPSSCRLMDLYSPKCFISEHSPYTKKHTKLTCWVDNSHCNWAIDPTTPTW